MAYVLKDSKGEAVKHQGQEVYAHDKAGSVKEINREMRTLTIVGSDETTDRDGDVLTVKGWELDNFLKNPVFLYAHNYSSVPIGSALKVIKKRDPVRLEFVEKFPTEGLYPFADMIFELFNEKILNASSVGFIPKKWEPLQNKDEADMETFNRGRRYVQQELLELSACPVPSNPNALQNSIKFMKTHTADQIALMLSGEMDLELKKEEVLGELTKEVEFEDEEKTKYFVPSNFETEKTKDEEFVTVKGELEGEKKDPDPTDKTEQVLVVGEKAGAVLNAKNKDRLIQAEKMIEEVLVEAGVDLTNLDQGASSFDGVLVSLSRLVEEIKGLKDQVAELQSDSILVRKAMEDLLPQPQGNGVDNIIVEGETLQDEYEKLLSPGDNGKQEEGAKEEELDDEDEQILKEVVNQLKQKFSKGE
jgi:hypothetical protein